MAWNSYNYYAYDDDDEEDYEEDDYFPGEDDEDDEHSACHIIFVVDVSASMRKCDVRQGAHRQRLAAVLDCCQKFLQQQIEDGADGRCSLIAFNDGASLEFSSSYLLGAVSQLENLDLQPAYGTQYLAGLQEVLDLLESYSADQHCILFLSDGLPGDLHMNSVRDEERLYEIMDELQGSCERLSFHTIGFGSADFVWLRKMAAAVQGKFHDTISTEFTQARTSSASSGQRQTLRPAVAPASYAPAGPSAWETISGDVLFWNEEQRTLHTAWTSVPAQMWTTPFATGTFRRAHSFRLAPGGQHVRKHLQLPNDLVSKDSTYHGQSQKLAFQGMVEHFKCLAAARAVARTMNKRIQTEIEFVVCYGYKATFRGQSRYLYIEPMLEGDYIKYNGNNGYVKLKHGLDAGASDAHDQAQAFSHYSWIHSNGRQLVCDIQGVGCRWTDPQVHSESKEYGSGDLGAEGIKMFFSTHRCNGYCRLLGITARWPAM